MYIWHYRSVSLRNFNGAFFWIAWISRPTDRKVARTLFKWLVITRHFHKKPWLQAVCHCERSISRPTANDLGHAPYSYQRGEGHHVLLVCQVFISRRLLDILSAYCYRIDLLLQKSCISFLTKAHSSPRSVHSCLVYFLIVMLLYFQWGYCCCCCYNILLFFGISRRTSSGAMQGFCFSICR